VADLLKLPLTNMPPGIPLGGAETFEEVFAKVDVNASDSLSWPEFASYFGQNHLALSSMNVGGGAKPGVMTRANMVRARAACSSAFPSVQHEMHSATHTACQR
jgi:hypothetical protein